MVLLQDSFDDGKKVVVFSKIFCCSRMALMNTSGSDVMPLTVDEHETHGAQVVWGIGVLDETLHFRSFVLSTGRSEGGLAGNL